MISKEVTVGLNISKVEFIWALVRFKLLVDWYSLRGVVKGLTFVIKSHNITWNLLKFLIVCFNFRLTGKYFVSFPFDKPGRTSCPHSLGPGNRKTKSDLELYVRWKYILITKQTPYCLCVLLYIYRLLSCIYRLLRRRFFSKALIWEL